MNNFNWKDPFLLSEQLNEEEKLVQQSAAQFALKELSSRLQAALNSGGIGRKGYQLIGQAGLFGVTLPHEFGGSLTLPASRHTGLIAREIERIDSGFRSILSVQSSLVMYPIFKFGSNLQKQTYLKN